MARRRNADKEQYWRQVLQAWQDSGLSVRAFCAQQGVNEPSFYCWRRNLRPADTAAGATSGASATPALPPDRDALPSFAPVRLVGDAAPATAAPLELALSGGRLLRVPVGFDAATLRQLLAVLEGASC